jgi:hypothetical protein
MSNRQTPDLASNFPLFRPEEVDSFPQKEEMGGRPKVPTMSAAGRPYSLLMAQGSQPAANFAFCLVLLTFDFCLLS